MDLSHKLQNFQPFCVVLTSSDLICSNITYVEVIQTQ